MKYGRVISIIFIIMLNNKTAANEIQPLSEIVITAEQFAYQQIQQDNDPSNLKITTGNLDPRLRLTLCKQPLQAFVPPGSRTVGNTTIGVKCDSPKPWSIYVPVRIALYEQVVIASTSLRRGQVISSSDIQTHEVDISQLRNVPYLLADSVIGNKTKQNINSGSVIHSGNICLVCKGDKVSITASASAIAVIMSGIALSDGSEGDAIRVQNSSSKRVIEATIVDRNTVVVGI